MASRRRVDPLPVVLQFIVDHAQRLHGNDGKRATLRGSCTTCQMQLTNYLWPLASRQGRGRWL